MEPEYLCPFVMVCGVYVGDDFSPHEKIMTSRSAMIKRNEKGYFCERRVVLKTGYRRDVDDARLPECALIAILNKIEDKK